METTPRDLKSQIEGSELAHLRTKAHRKPSRLSANPERDPISDAGFRCSRKALQLNLI